MPNLFQHSHAQCGPKLRAAQYSQRRVACPSAVLKAHSTESDLAKVFEIETAAVQGQGRDDRGLILINDVERKRAVARIPLRNVLLVTDEPTEKLSIFGANKPCCGACLLCSVASCLETTVHPGVVYEHEVLSACSLPKVTGSEAWQRSRCCETLTLLHSAPAPL